jgi:hypothetical protein
MIAYVLRSVVCDEAPSCQIANSYLTGTEQVNYFAFMHNMELL